jgi:predicted TIM-barrel fold metal-dependent hydrolase
MGLSAGSVMRAIEVYGIDHIVFGTDWGPVPVSPREHLDMVLGLPISASDCQKILWRNADGLLRLGLTESSPEPDAAPARHDAAVSPGTGRLD